LARTVHHYVPTLKSKSSHSGKRIRRDDRCAE
jgi:hypothetical protein